MKNIALKNIIVPTKLTSNNGVEIEDLVYLDSIEELSEMNSSPEQLKISATDWAQGIQYCDIERRTVGLDSLRSHIPVRNNNPVDYLLRSTSSNNGFHSVNTNGELETAGHGFSPLSTQLDVQSVVDAQKSGALKINRVAGAKGRELYHTIEFGEYPNSHVGPLLNAKLTALLDRRKLTPTGKVHTVQVGAGNARYGFPEFEYRGEKYTFLVERYSVVKRVHDEGKVLEEETRERIHWYKVEPMTWVVRNWKDLPKEINPDGNGTANTVSLRTEKAVMYWRAASNIFEGVNWENCPARAYLNGLTTDEVQPENKWQNTSAQNFIDQALSQEIGFDLEKNKKPESQPE